MEYKFSSCKERNLSDYDNGKLIDEPLF